MFHRPRSLQRSIALALSLLSWAAAAPCEDAPAPREPVAPAAPWEGDIRAFEARDRESPPPADPILFVGSSSIRLWDLAASFPGEKVLNRGFGGSRIADSVRFAPRIVVPYRPRAIVLYAGDNDLAGGMSPEAVEADFRRFLQVIDRDLPGTPIVYIAIKPSIARWGLIDRIRDANRRIRAAAEARPRTWFLDIEEPMLGADGKPRRDLLAEDGLHLNADGYALWAYLLRPLLGLAEEGNAGRLLVATCQFPVSSSVRENARWIREQMDSARRKGADLAHFPETALSGYAGVDHRDLSGFDWAAQDEELGTILDLAARLRLWVVLGAAHRLGGEHKPHDSLYVISPEGKIVDRYDKRFCTGGDLRHYTPGDHLSTFEVNGVRCGLLICYDIRFPEIYRQYVLRDARLIFHSFYNARQEAGAIHPRIMPPTAQAHAGMNNVFISVSNACAPRSWEGLFVTPDGLIAQRLVLDAPGVMVNLVDANRRYYDASEPYRRDAILGRLHSGETVDDPRSADRTCR